MASGHVNRIKRPNTWLQRPMLQNREESSCQTGAVHTWHFSDLTGQTHDVRCLKAKSTRDDLLLIETETLESRNNASACAARKPPTELGEEVYCRS
jgi:hypothetical protein